ncbi:hypothetical protein Y032_0265g658 [Ancylostoma ceylanicum]|uniref:Secreted peptide n=1 Tax=Ancylostoma ceylanicum TaxID=53326 RepID=A0A016SA79_9BILA|nr:hypothetical protein Y032_0265g658 [Ancylostoma ceylanicum]
MVRFPLLCILIVGGASLAWVAAVAAVVDNSDHRRRCRRQRRPTVAAVVDTPSSIPIDDSGDDRGDKGRVFTF